MKSDMGHRKWLDEYPVLKQVAEKQPFTVPPSYFDELEQRIVSAIKLEELKTGKGFTAPVNYFDELTGNIQSRITIEAFENGKGLTVPADYFDELSGNIQSRITIEAFENGKGLTVPANYFNELSDNIQSRIAIEEFIDHSAAGHVVPADYFENLEQQITARIAIEETLNNEDFTVPAGYFESLNKAILDKTVKQEKEERRGVVRKMFAYSAIKYAAAACFALMVGTGIFIAELTTPPPAEHNKTFLHKQLSKVSTHDIQTYLQDEVDANETQHIVIDDASADDANLNSALQSISANN